MDKLVVLCFKVLKDQVKQLMCKLSIHYGKLRFKLRHHHCKSCLCRCTFKHTAPKCICIFQY